MPTNTYYLIRHGQTQENLLGILQGKMDTVLNTTGKRQAHELADCFRDYAVDYMYSSPLTRAFETSHILLTKHRTLKSIILDPRLKEVDIGDYEGMTKEQVSIDEMNNPPNGETIEQVYDRVVDFYNFLEHKYNGKSIAIVSHNIVIKSLINHTVYGRCAPLDRNMHIKNCQIINIKP